MPAISWFAGMARSYMGSYMYYFFFSGRFQPGLVDWVLSFIVSSPAGASFHTVVPAPIVAPLPTVTGATSCVSEPMNTSSSMMVRCLFAPS